MSDGPGEEKTAADAGLPAAESAGEPAVHACAAALKWVKYLGLAFACLLLGIWAVSAGAAFLANKKRLARLEPLLAQADGLALHFDQVTAAPEKHAGLTVLWCVQSRSSSEVFYKMDARRALRVSNPEKMPITGAGKQIGCSDMLFRVKGGRKILPAGGVVEAEFLGVP